MTSGADGSGSARERWLEGYWISSGLVRYRVRERRRSRSGVGGASGGNTEVVDTGSEEGWMLWTGSM